MICRSLVIVGVAFALTACSDSEPDLSGVEVVSPALFFDPQASDPEKLIVYPGDMLEWLYSELLSGRSEAAWQSLRSMQGSSKKGFYLLGIAHDDDTDRIGLSIAVMDLNIPVRDLDQSDIHWAIGDSELDVKSTVKLAMPQSVRETIAALGPKWSDLVVWKIHVEFDQSVLFSQTSSVTIRLAVADWEDTVELPHSTLPYGLRVSADGQAEDAGRYLMIPAGTPSRRGQACIYFMQTDTGKVCAIVVDVANGIIEISGVPGVDADFQQSLAGPAGADSTAPEIPADTVVAQAGVSLMAASTHEGDELLFALDNSTGKLVVYLPDLQRNTLTPQAEYDLDKVFAGGDAGR